MKRKEEISQELSTISQVVADIPFQPTFSVPDDYFDQISAPILFQIVGNSTTLSVPENYFDHLPLEVVKQSITHPPLPFQVPDNYFDSIEAQVMSKIKEVPKNSPVFKMVTRWSMAAAVIGLLGWGLVSYFTSFSQNELLTTELAEAKKIIQQQSFEKEWESLDEKSMMEFLHQTGHDVSSAMVATLAVDANNLPEVEDYIFDESTLNNFLNKANMADIHQSQN